MVTFGYGRLGGGNRWLRMVLNDYVWLRVVMVGFGLLWVVIGWLRVVMSGYRWLRVVIGW